MKTRIVRSYKLKWLEELCQWMLPAALNES
jgi:hypothetical protein